MRVRDIFPTKKLVDLVPGDVVDIWYLEQGPQSTVKEVKIIERPNMKHNLVKVIMEDGSYIGMMERSLPTIKATCVVKRKPNV